MYKQPLSIFLCHSSGDKQAVRQLCGRLRADGYLPWLDEEDLIAGQEWDREISKAVRRSDVVLVCISRQSINKRGFVQKEIKFALSVAEELPDDSIFIIPLKLEECEVPDRLSRYHWINFFDEAGYERLIIALARCTNTTSSHDRSSRSPNDVPIDGKSLTEDLESLKLENAISLKKERLKAQSVLEKVTSLVHTLHPMRAFSGRPPLNKSVAISLGILLISAIGFFSLRFYNATRAISSIAAVQSEGLESEAWDNYVKDFLENYFISHPDFAVRAGRHEFDGKLPDWSTKGLANLKEQLHEERNRAVAFPDAPLSKRQRFEREYLIALLDGELFWLESAEWPYRCPQFYADAIDPDVYVSREYAPLDLRLKAFTTYAKAVPTAVEQIRKNLRTPMPKTFVSIGHTTFGGLISFYEKDIPAIFAGVEDEQLQADFQQANERAIKAMKGMDEWFTSLEATANDNFALGEEKFSKMLKATELVDIPLAELAAVGRKDLDRNLAALKEACASFDPRKSISECVAKAQANKPTGGAVAEARKQLGELKAFIQKKKLVSIPGPEENWVAAAPAYRRWNFAYINIPGPYEKYLPPVYYIAPPDPAWSEQEKEAYAPGIGSLLFTSVHEVWPGHFLQSLHANRSPSKLGQLFIGYAFAEGWAHYTEEMMWDAGLENNSPEMHIGQLLEALLRNVRFVSAIEMHTGKMTLAESEKMFLERGYQDPGSARQQAARGTFDPAYLNYTMGKLMIRKLREDWTATRSGKQAWQAFHDEFLKFGGPPIPLVRAAMLGGPKGSLF